MSAERLQVGLERLRSRYRVHLPDGALSRTGYLAGDDDRRAEALNACLRDPEVRAVILARGGYGLMRILHLLDSDALRRDPKLLVGFSDATVLLAWARREANLRCIHGPMAAQLGELPDADVEWLFRLMEDPRPAGPIPASLQPMTMLASPDTDPVEGVLEGGNLCLLSHLQGTPYSPDFSGRVLLLEEVGERPYRIDRDLTHLGLAGAFDQLAAVVLGDITECEETIHSDHPEPLEVIRERLERYGVIAAQGLPSGHGARNLAIPLGARCALDLRRGQLELLEAAVTAP